MLLTMAVVCCLAYLIGSIPTSVLVSKKVFNIDIRDYGSGNAGATNSFRFLGKKWSIFILIVDISKGIIAVNMACIVGRDFLATESAFLNLKLFLGFLSIVGHIYPIFVNFRGGKGIATMFGVIIAVSPTFALITAITFFIVFMITHYVALGSILGAIIFAINMMLFNEGGFNLVAFGLSALCTILVTLKHITNISRIIKGIEKKMYINKKSQEKL